VSPDRRQQLLDCLRSVASREAITFADVPTTSALLDGAHLLLLSAYAPGEYMVDLEPYADYRVLEQCDIDAELAGVA
jgi:hypothetical protein